MKQSYFLAGTLSACRFHGNLPVHYVSNVVIDEAGQTYEAETGSALSIARERVVLVGDHHQFVKNLYAVTVLTDPY